MLSPIHCSNAEGTRPGSLWQGSGHPSEAHLEEAGYRVPVLERAELRDVGNREKAFI